METRIIRRLSSKPHVLAPGIGRTKRRRFFITTAFLLAFGFLALCLPFTRQIDEFRSKIAYGEQGARSVKRTTHSIADTVGCQDMFPEDCPKRAALGECHAAHPGFMYDRCLAACGGCVGRFTHNVPRQVQLKPGVIMPVIGLGTAGIGGNTAKVVEDALRIGYRRIDSAQAREWYREDLVGEGLAASTIPRDKVFITTKVHPREFGSASTRRALNKTLQDLRTTYVDLVLLHYSECWGNLCADKKPEGDWKEAWRALELLVDANVVRCIGVSNFGIDDTAKLLRFARHKPCLLQRNSEPLNPDVASQAFCRHHGIQYEGYSTLGGQYNHKQSGNPILEHPVITVMASARGRTPAQLVLRWALQQNQAVIPRSSNRDHLRENLNGVFDFDLTDDELYTLASLP